ncbi:MAG: DUF3422 domain-containing protein, partial [Pseudomonadota bacterium]
MATTILDNYPNRYALANELHARPFPELKAPCRAAFLAIKNPVGAAERDRDQDRAHLIALLDRYGAPHPAPGANHHSAQLGRGFLKWEQHTEFVTYTIFADGVAAKPFDGTLHALYPADWLAESPGKVLTSALVRIEKTGSAAEMDARLTEVHSDWFVPESLAQSRVVDGIATIASDFRIDEHGHVRMAVFVDDGIGQRRLGRITQRLLEIETYKSMSMLTLPVARDVGRKVADLDRRLASIVAQMAEGTGDERAELDELLKISAEVEHLSSSTAFRFGAAGAYEAIVNQRIEVLREVRVNGRQTFAEFMMRRYEPAMRTCRSSAERLGELSLRAARAANLLRTRVDVQASEANAKVLERMDERAALQLRLQETVEGLSVVAISYYAVNLAGNILSPVGAMAGLSKPMVLAVLTVPVVLLVW